jgi:transcriptional regulator with XRE-family HTH domain
MQETKETIGQRLKQIRLSRQLSIEKAAEATRVRTHYLQALEADNYSVMSSAAQSRGFLRLYADFLGLDLEAAMNELRQEEKVVDAPPETPAPFDFAQDKPAPVTPALEPVPAPQTPPASLPDERPVRRPFWARLLRRPVAETSPQGEPAPATEPAPITVAAAEPLIVSEPEPAPAKKPAVKKSKATAKTSTPKTGKPKAAAKSTAKVDDKKKASLKSQPSKRR